jgi:hypothetical protein
MAVVHVNRERKEYYLHQRTDKKGGTRYHFSTSREGALAEEIPDGYEIYENPNGQVFLRRTDKIRILDREVSLVSAGVKRHTRLKNFLVDKKPRAIVICTPVQSVDDLTTILSQFTPFPTDAVASTVADFVDYEPMMRFTLVDEDERLFQAERYCFKGGIDDWIEIGDADRLDRLVKTYVRHLDRDSFYDLY